MGILLNNSMLMMSYVHVCSNEDWNIIYLLAIYVDDMNLIRTRNEIEKAAEYLKR